MRAFFLGSTILALYSAPCFAQTQHSVWSGAYVGAIAGYARSDASAQFSMPPEFTGAAGSSPQADAGLSAGPVAATKLSDRAFTGGVVAGYNSQTQGVVVGVELELSSLRLKNSKQTVGFSDPVHLWRDTIDTEISTNWLFSVRPRFGYALGSVLIYGTGGLAVTRLTAKQSQHNVDICCGPPVEGYSESVATTKTKYGWTVGGGLEYALNRNWTIKGEYLYTDFGKIRSVGLTTNSGYGLVGNLFNHEFEMNTHVIRTGVNYRF